MLQVLQLWGHIFSTAKVLGRTTYIAALLEAEVCKTEQDLALPSYKRSLHIQRDSVEVMTSDLGSSGVMLAETQFPSI